MNKPHEHCFVEPLFGCNNRPKIHFLVFIYKVFFFSSPAGFCLLLLQILSLLTNLQRCADLSSLQLEPASSLIFSSLCSLSAQEWYSLTLLSARHVSMEDVMYKVNVPFQFGGGVNFLLWFGHETRTRRSFLVMLCTVCVSVHQMSL